MILMPRESGKLIASLSKDVFIEEEGVKRIAYEVLEGLKTRAVHVDNFSQHELHPNENDAHAVDWIFVLDTLNFCFWTEGNDTKWKVAGHTGYFALCAAIERAISMSLTIRDLELVSMMSEMGAHILDLLQMGRPRITNPEFYSTISEAELRQILRGDDESSRIPLFNERVKCLHQVGKVLMEKYGGTFVNCIKACDNSAEKLLKLIVTEFECFRDDADYRGHKVAIYKRAQILVGDIWACFRGKGLGEFHDIEMITMFADYRVPQVLVHFGAMRYSNPLLDTLQSDTELTPGSTAEVEIRGCSIEVIERVRDEVKSLIRQYPNLGLRESDCNAILIDHFLWDYRRRHAVELESIPFHKVKSIYY